MANMELIETKTVTGSTVADIEFTSIPSTYTDLIVKFTCRTDHANGVTNFYVSFNGVTSSLSGNRLYGAGGSGTAAEANGYGLSTGNNATSNVFTNAELFIPNYASAKYKTFTLDCAAENGNSTAYVAMAGGKWASTAAINAVKLTPNAGNGWLPGSTFSLYGVSKVPSSPKATGGIVSQDATYWYHTFPFSSTFTPTQALSADCLLIAGGGGGVNGGGGAGGLRLISSQSLTTTGYTVTVGAGGSASNSGSNSSFNSNSATGGGKGGSAAGTAGGSGGGGGNDAPNTGGAGNAGSYSPVEGYAGGNGSSTSGGGGGGAGQVGSNSSGANGAVGGNGVNTYASWANATFTGVNGYYAGGGGGAGSSTGAAGGLGGGGAAEITSSVRGVNGITNTGSGGGGGYYIGAGAGGSGLVIIRYAK